jgi:hypothetical protein
MQSFGLWKKYIKVKFNACIMDKVQSNVHEECEYQDLGQLSLQHVSMTCCVK